MAATARAGESGIAVSLACQRYVFGLEAIESLIRQKIPVEPLTDDLYAQDKSAGMRIRTAHDHYEDRYPRTTGNRRRPPRAKTGRGDRTRPGKAVGSHERSSARSEHTRDGVRKRPERRSGETRGGQRRVEVPTGSAKASDSVASRLAYYRKKYGEDFQPTGEMLANMHGGENDASKRSRSNKKRRRSSNRGAANAQKGAPTRSHSEKTAAKRHGEPRHEKQPQPRSTKEDRPSTAPREEKGILGALKRIFSGRKR